MVEAAGVEPAPPPNADWLMARDFRRNGLTTGCLVVNLLSSGVLPSLGDIVETVGIRPLVKAAGCRVLQIAQT